MFNYLELTALVLTVINSFMVVFIYNFITTKNRKIVTLKDEIYELLGIRDTLLMRIEKCNETIEEKRDIISEFRDASSQLLVETGNLKNELNQLKNKKIERVPVHLLDQLIILKKSELLEEYKKIALN